MTYFRSKPTAQRRNFLKRSACMALLGSGTAAMSGKLQLMSSAMAQSSSYADLDDYKALVCVFLYGGADSFSMFLPSDDDAYDQYASSRASLAVDRSTLLPTSGPVSFNPKLSRLHGLYEAGDAALLANVGNLITPVTRNMVINQPHLVPSDLFAHNHQQDQWMKGNSSVPSSLVQSGWGGRMADLLQDANTGALLPPHFSLFGSNSFLPGNLVQPLALNTNNGLSLLTYLDGAANADRSNTHDAMLNQSYSHPLKQQAANTIARAKSGSSQVREVLAANQTFNTPFNAGSRLAQQLRMVARLIAGQEALNMRRQVFFVGLGGWDTHDHQTPRLDELLTELDNSLGDFYATLEELQVTDSVTTFTASDFGRTLTINGDGSDHGWGGHHLVMGGAVNGNQMLGSLPSFEIAGDDDSGDKGRVIPNVSINQYGALLGQWMGITSSDLAEVFPDLANFGSDWEQGFDLFNA